MRPVVFYLQPGTVSQIRQAADCLAHCNLRLRQLAPAHPGSDLFGDALGERRPDVRYIDAHNGILIAKYHHVNLPAKILFSHMLTV